VADFAKWHSGYSNGYNPWELFTHLTFVDFVSKSVVASREGFGQGDGVGTEEMMG
jgi:hypothetical protein